MTCNCSVNAQIKAQIRLLILEINITNNNQLYTCPHSSRFLFQINALSVLGQGVGKENRPTEASGRDENKSSFSSVPPPQKNNSSQSSRSSPRERFIRCQWVASYQQP